MKIAFVSDAAYPWNVGGLETLEKVEAVSLAKEHELHFFSFKWSGMKREFTNDGIHYHTFHEINNEKFYRHGRRSIREAVVFAVGILRIFKYRFDVIQTNEFPILHVLPLKVYCLLTRCKLIIDMHEVWDRSYWTTYLGPVIGPFANAYASWVIKMADSYIANSSTTAGKLERMGIKKEKINTFSPVIDDGEMRKVGKIAQKKQIIFAGRLIKEKRLDKWLKIMKRIAQEHRVKGVIIGEGPEENSIKKQIKALSLQKIVELRSFYKDKRDLYRRIKESSLLLQMSEREGLSLIALESIALGTPVLLPTYSPIPEDVRSMCIVEDESKICKTALRMLDGPKYRYINDIENINRFYISRLGVFYKEIFSKLK
jgi:glycosyltransferase involved in cell wall biosynthesis